MEPYLREYEEFKPLSPFWGWVLLFLICLLLVEFGHLHHHVIQDAPRDWDFGEMQVAPGESKYTTFLPPAGVAPLQMHALPEAHALKKLSADTASSFQKGCPE